jgi:Lhr-like helicase
MFSVKLIITLCVYVSVPQDERDEALYCLLAAHPGRTIVFANAVSTIRRVAAILQQLGIPAAPLHASMQQRQRLKVRNAQEAVKGRIRNSPPCSLALPGRAGLCQGVVTHSSAWLDWVSAENGDIYVWPRTIAQSLDRFKSSPDGVLVATDVAARGLDVKGVACVVHYQVSQQLPGPCAMFRLVHPLVCPASISSLLCAASWTAHGPERFQTIAWTFHA